MVVWLIGMSASGKTTIAREMIQRLGHAVDDSTWVLLDGDEVRALAGCDVDHTIIGRKKNAERICKYCLDLDKQGKNVIACVLSIFHESQDWLRENIKNYKQIYIKSDYDVLKLRDNKSLYLNAEKGAINNVVGVDIDFPEPKQSDFVIVNEEESDPFELAETILKKLEILPAVRYKYSDGDLLESPNKYQYTQYEGKQFLDAYRESRESAIKSLKSRELDFTLDDVIKGFSKDKAYTATGLITTRNYLLCELTDVIVGNWQLAERLDVLLTLIQRFEVSKKVYVHYKDFNFRKIDDNFSDLTNFILFHILLCEVSELVDKSVALICINSLLKIGDILVANKKSFIEHQDLLIFALGKELLVMQEQFNV